MKTLEEIKARVEAQIADPIDGMMIAMSGVHPLMIYHRDFLKDEYKDKVKPLTEENIIADMKDYIDFAFSKAYGCRGISSSRSIFKYQEWLWALDHPLYDFAMDDDNYAMYGVPILRKICETFGFIDPHPECVVCHEHEEYWAPR